MNRHVLMRTTRLRVLALLTTGLLLQPSVAMATASAAEPGPADDLQLTVAATEITETDTNLAHTTNEVVAVVTTADGLEVRKFATSSPKDAAKLVADLNTQSGVVADLNRAVTIPDEPTITNAPSKGKGGWDHGAPGARGKASPATLSGRINDEPRGDEQWGLRAVNAEGAWEVTDGANVMVAVVDSGVDAEHPDLAGRVLPQISEVSGAPGGDPNGHGTHVAGIIGAALDGNGVAGLADAVTILPVQVFDANGVGDEFTVAVGISDAVDAGADVINLSLGGGYSEVEESLVEYAVSEGVTVVAAGGNEFENGNPVTFPAAYDGVIGVSSVDSEGYSSEFANVGDYIDISAPGEDILSTVPNGGWDYKDGTSMAAPFVSATAALVRSANPTLDKEEVDATILGTTWDEGYDDGWDPVFGYGFLQADQATIAAANEPGGLYGPPAPSAPSLPTTVKAVAGNGSAVVSWSPPTNNGGAAVTGYTVTAFPSGRTCTTSGSTSCTVTGLANGTEHEFTVRAHNEAGWSRSAWSGPVTPLATVTVSAARAGYGNVLAVNINPNRGSASYAFRVQQRARNGSWTTLSPVYRSEGSGETKSITLGAGTYRAYVPASGAYGSAVSPSVSLTAPTAIANVSRDAARNKLKVNVDPNKGSGYWSFKVQKRNANGSWSTLSTLYRTEGSGETRTINLPRGTYRVKVYAKYGYLGTTSSSVSLSK